MKLFLFFICVSISASSFAEKFDCQIETSSIIDEKSGLFGDSGYTFKTNGKENKRIFYFIEEGESYYSADGEKYPLTKIENNYFLEKTGAGNINFVKALKTSKGKFISVSKSFSFTDTIMVSNILFKCN